MTPHAADTAIPAGSDVPQTASRLPAGAVFLVSVAVLVVAFMLSPNSKGVDTHLAMGLPACGLLQNTGIPCATCGMTTAFSYAAHGNLLASFVTQPAGAVLALLTAMAAVLAGYALISGMSLTPIGVMIWRPRVVVIAAAVLLLAWVYKIVILTGMIGANV